VVSSTEIRYDDRTDLKALVRAYQNPNARHYLLELAGQLTNIGYWIYDLTRDEIYWSDELYDIAGVNRETFELTLRAALDAYHPDDREIVKACALEAARTGNDFEYEVRVLQPSGDIRHVACVGTCEVGADGSVLGLFAAFQDITERKSVHGRLMRTQHLASVGSVATGIAHGVNNPLTSLFVNLELALEELEFLGQDDFDPSLLRDALEQARDGAEQVRQVVRGLKAFAREEQAKAGPTHFRNVVDVALGVTQNELRHRARLTTDFEPAPSVIAVRSRLEQVVVGLVTYCIGALDGVPLDEASISVSIHPDADGNALLEVAHNHSKVTQDVLEKMFKQMEPLSDAGGGLGLSVCHAIVHEDGGALCAQVDDGWTRFRVRFPAAEPFERGATSETDSIAFDDDERESARVLVVDDEEIVGNSVSRILPRDEVTVALSGPEALEILQKAGDNAFDIILCDMMMPGMSGEELFYELEESFPTSAERVVFVTGGVFGDDASSFLARRPGRWLAKPYDVSEIRSLVARSSQR
jgi:PAS domain S-box-containing protein